MAPVAKAQIAAVRRFNRFYTRQIGVLDAGHLGSRFSITEARVLYELTHRRRLTAGILARDLGLDEGYLSRMLRRFEQMALLRRDSSREDARVSRLRLTAEGRAAFKPLNTRADKAVRDLLGGVPPAARDEAVAAMGSVQRALVPQSSSLASRVRLRPHRAGDMGWIIHRHGVLYGREYGYDARFEAIVAKVAGEFLEHFDARRERCWIAERDGEVLGSVMIVKKTPTVAKLRLLYLEPEARGIGLGRRLVAECVRFAKRAGYRKITLWTQSSLIAARHIYQTSGFRLVGTKAHADFGPREAAETWERTLR